MTAESHNISFAIAFSAGFLSFVSPCVLPLIPSYVSYITGISFEDLVYEMVDADLELLKAQIGR